MSLASPVDTALENRQQLLRCARGEEPCDLVLKNAQVINTFTGEILNQDVGLCQGLIAGLGQYHGHREIDIKQRYLCPGFIEGHIHIESSMLCPAGFAEAVVPRGTTAVVCDPHEIANVLGLEGILYMLKSAENLPLDIFAMIPSCVPATHMETSGATLTAKEISQLFDLSGVVGLAEMMNFPGTIYGAPDVIMKLGVALERGMIIDGHAPGLTGKQLQAYCGAGISSDHECTTLAEAREKLRAGMYIFIREGSTAKNLEALLPLVSPATARRFLLVSDDRHPDDLLEEGHLDSILKRAVALGLDPVIALQMVTINPAERFDLKMRGAIAPGYLADLTVLDDLIYFTPYQVYKRGKLVAENGQSIMFTSSPRTVEKTAAEATNTIHINWQNVDFSIPAQKGLIRVITCIENQIVTGMREIEPTIIDGYTVADPARDLLKISVIERHRASGSMTNGFVRGFGIKQGAIASTVAHDSHNLIIIGTDDEVMLAAAHLVADNGGGIALIHNDKSIVLPLPVAGLMSTASADEVTARLSDMKRLAKQMGVRGANPFMLLSFLALPVIPSFKITDQGLIDVDSFQTVPLYV
jgi:adenine deaminase